MEKVIKENEKTVEMQITISIPKKAGKSVGSDFDIDKCKQRAIAVMLDIVGAFSPVIIASLERRLQACQNLLIAHLEDIEYNDGRHIVWRKNERVGTFNVPSYIAMQDAILLLKGSEFKTFCEGRIYIDQTIKALLNDTEQDHSDKGGFKYSQLVSILCELQACPIG